MSRSIEPHSVAPLSVADLRRALDGHRHARVPLAGFMRQAAVAAIARDAPGGAELLFIRRAERHGDPWSGHMAFPGGRVDPVDASPLAAAVRETREEVDLDLDARAVLIGGLSELPAMAHGKPLPMVVIPFVFALDAREPPALRPNHEVQEVVWVPMEFFRAAANRGTIPWKKAGVSFELPCYRYEGHVIWGLTLKIVDELIEQLGATSSQQR